MWTALEGIHGLSPHFSFAKFQILCLFWLFINLEDNINYFNWILTVVHKYVICVKILDFNEYAHNGWSFYSHTFSIPELNSWVKAFRCVIFIAFIKTHHMSPVVFVDFHIYHSVGKDVTMEAERSRSSCVSFVTGHIKSCQFDVEAVRVRTFPFLLLQCQVGPGGRLNKKDGLTRYGNSHVKDKTS